MRIPRSLLIHAPHALLGMRSLIFRLLKKLHVPSRSFLAKKFITVKYPFNQHENQKLRLIRERLLSAGARALAGAKADVGLLDVGEDALAVDMVGAAAVVDL